MAALRNGDVASCSRLLLLLRSVWGLFKPYRQALGEVKKPYISIYHITVRSAIVGSLTFFYHRRQRAAA